MKYQYTTISETYDTKGKYTRRPLLQLELLEKGKSVTVYGLIDSGADLTLINIEYASSLGIPLHKNNTKEFIGIGGRPIVCYLHTISIRPEHFTTPVKIPVAFIESNAVDVLLGQEGFFDLYRIKFEKDHGVFEITQSLKKR